MTKSVQSHDLGFAIRDFLEGQRIALHVERAGEFVQERTRAIEAIDISDPSNLLVYLDNGQVFIVRIITGT